MTTDNKRDPADVLKAYDAYIESPADRIFPARSDLASALCDVLKNYQEAVHRFAECVTERDQLRARLDKAEVVVRAARDFYAFTAGMDGLGQSGIHYRSKVCDALADEFDGTLPDPHAALQEYEATCRAAGDSENGHAFEEDAHNLAAALRDTLAENKRLRLAHADDIARAYPSLRAECESLRADIERGLKPTLAETIRARDEARSIVSLVRSLLSEDGVKDSLAHLSVFHVLLERLG